MELLRADLKPGKNIQFFISGVGMSIMITAVVEKRVGNRVETRQWGWGNHMELTLELDETSRVTAVSWDREFNVLPYKNVVRYEGDKWVYTDGHTGAIQENVNVIVRPAPFQPPRTSNCCCIV